MNRTRCKWLIVLPFTFQLALVLPCSAGETRPPPASSSPDLEYYKIVNHKVPPQDPQLLFLLMAQYISANRQAEGAEFFVARLKGFEPRLTDVQKALYLSAASLLRGQHASAVPLLHRVAWVKETISMLD